MKLTTIKNTASLPKCKNDLQSCRIRHEEPGRPWDNFNLLSLTGDVKITARVIKNPSLKGV